VTVARLLLVNALIRAAAAASGQLFAFVLAERLASRSGVGAMLVGMLGASFFLTEIVGAPIAGRIADGRGHRRVMRYGPVFGATCGLVGALSAFAPIGLGLLAFVLLVARTTEGLSAACTTPTTLVLLSRATEGDAARRTRMMGIFEISSLVAMIMGYAIAGIAWDSAGPKAFLALPLLYTLAWVLVGASAPERSTESREHLPVLRLARALGAERGNLPFAAAWLSVNAVVGVWMQQSPYLLKLADRSATQSLVGGFTGRQIGQVFGVFGLTFLGGVTLWSVFGARMPRRRALAVALVGMLGVVSFLALRNHGAGRWALGLAMVCVLVESGFTPAAFAHLADATEVHDGSRGAALGLYSLLLGSGQLLGNALGAPFAMRWQMDGVLGLTALLASIALLGVLRMSPTTRGREVGGGSRAVTSPMRGAEDGGRCARATVLSYEARGESFRE